jgi:Rrf2 family protein
MSKIVTLSEASAIALHGMILVAQSDGLINVIQIAEKTESSKHHVAKVFQRLVKEGLIISQRGPKGGFKLTKKPEEITFLTVYEAIEGSISVVECPIEKPNCPFKKCILNGVTQRMTKEFKKYLSEQTLDMYLKH